MPMHIKVIAEHCFLEILFRMFIFNILSDLEMFQSSYVLLRLLEDGDHLAVEGGSTGLHLYDHHGIFVGHKEGVIDFNDESGGKLRLIDISVFHDDKKRPLKRICYKSGQCLEPFKVVENAKMLLNNQTEWRKFNLIYNNCEHFATYCKCGNATSKQTDAIQNALNVYKKFVKEAKGKSFSLKLKVKKCCNI